jgi:hypothetical protein
MNTFYDLLAWEIFHAPLPLAVRARRIRELHPRTRERVRQTQTYKQLTKGQQK